MRNKYLYIILTVLLVLVILFGTMILSLTNRVGNIEKSEATSLQLSETNSNNAYISTSAHLAELSSLSGSTWTLIGKKTGTSPVTIDTSKYTEFLIDIQRGTSDENYLSIFLIKDQLSSTQKVYNVGYDDGASSRSTCRVRIGTTTTQIQLLTLWNSGSEISSSSSIAVYGR